MCKKMNFYIFRILNFLSLLIWYFLDDEEEEEGKSSEIWLIWICTVLGLTFILPLPAIYYQRLRTKRIKGPIKKWNAKYQDQKLVAVVNSHMIKMMRLCNCDKRSHKWFSKMAIQIHLES